MRFTLSNSSTCHNFGNRMSKQMTRSTQWLFFLALGLRSLLFHDEIQPNFAVRTKKVFPCLWKKPMTNCANTEPNCRFGNDQEHRLSAMRSYGNINVLRAASLTLWIFCFTKPSYKYYFSNLYRLLFCFHNSDFWLLRSNKSDMNQNILYVQNSGEWIHRKFPLWVDWSK